MLEEVKRAILETLHKDMTSKEGAYKDVAILPGEIRWTLTVEVPIMNRDGRTGSYTTGFSWTEE